MPVSFRLRSNHGSEKVIIRVGATTDTVTVPREGETFTYALPAKDDDWSLEFTNDSSWPGPTRDVWMQSLSANVKMSMSLPRLWERWDCDNADRAKQNMHCDNVRSDGGMFWNGKISEKF